MAVTGAMGDVEWWDGGGAAASGGDNNASSARINVPDFVRPSPGSTNTAQRRTTPVLQHTHISSRSGNCTPKRKV
ncbi:hypothetical protein Dda_6037 [Drechslerella dactyloides]|uniref:Uncharacterized protein n=1 Tax=Drechslerella dactyloides TaxID=74499 RepID=A0AAD6IX03_DREDA|nr:hypothetical protein Dda_6037 [Drechslerella dactyloides]